METKDFDYKLPENLIAKFPVSPRDSSRLLVLDKKKQTYKHKIFHEIFDFLSSGDVLVINETKVLPARLFAKKEETGAKIEVLLLEEISLNCWKTFAKPAKRLKTGTVLNFSENLKGTVTKIFDEGEREIFFSGSFWEEIEKIGKIPLPPYVLREANEKDKETYQTVYAKKRGAIAAPTAGLHFTNELLEKIRAKGVKILPLTLHVGAGTFKPVSVEKITEHKMHSEFFEIPQETATEISACKERGNKVFVVGTTSVRALESATSVKNGKLEFVRLSGKTEIFIFPPYSFKVADAIVTNFHLPFSTLLMLVSAFAGKDFVLEAYKFAVQENYRFYSYGDAMLLIC
ncbi:tRNA preQ1(34) S-adenosylmethionine ribosyltransferase-isomerase QueA [bacterium]|nr:tRNA preQ1(34) S-adenosylmethionine ribosyltransferase-isomerase QueA [bacterium]